MWRGTDKWGLRGLRVNGGTSTGRSVRDLCHTSLDGPDVKQHDGVTPACNPYRRWDTNVRGTAAYTILPDKPWADILVSTVFQWRPGVQRDANHTFTKDQVTWEASSAARATQPCPAGPTAGQVGCFTAAGTTTATTYTVNLLNTGELYGEGYTIFDLKLAKNIRFANKRLNVGVDIYNLFNNDAIRTYENNFDTVDNPTTPVVEQWGQATELLSPRFVRLSIQFDFYTKDTKGSRAERRASPTQLAPASGPGFPAKSRPSFFVRELLSVRLSGHYELSIPSHEGLTADHAVAFAEGDDLIRRHVLHDVHPPARPQHLDSIGALAAPRPKCARRSF